jgi:hypothetical protein
MSHGRCGSYNRAWVVGEDGQSRIIRHWAGLDRDRRRVQLAGVVMPLVGLRSPCNDAEGLGIRARSATALVGGARVGVIVAGLAPSAEV